LVAKEEEIAKMVDGSPCEVNSTGTVKVTERNGMVRALEVIRYVPEAHYNLISVSHLEKDE